MMEVKQNTAVDLNDLLAPVNNNDDGTDEVDDVVMTDLTEEARDLNTDLIQPNEKCNNGLITNGDETLSSLIDLDATAASLDLDSSAAALEEPVSTELEDALLAEDDVLPKLTDAKANVAPSSDDILADKVETSNSTTSSTNVRDPGDDLDTLLSKINDIVEDCLDNEITTAAVEEKDQDETKETEKIADAASDLKAECFDESVILLDDTAIEESTTENDKINPDELENHQQADKSVINDTDKETEKDLKNGNNSESETKTEDETETVVAEVSATKISTSETATTDVSTADVAVIETASVVSETAVAETDPTEVTSDILDEKEDETVDDKSEEDVSDVTKDTTSITLISEKQIEEDSKLLDEDISNTSELKTGEEELKNSEEESTNDEQKTKTDEQECKEDEEESKTDTQKPKMDGQQSTAVTDQQKDEDKVENEDSDDEIVFYVDKPPETEKSKKTVVETEPTPTTSEKKTEEEAQQEEQSKSTDDDDVVILDDDEEMETEKKISESSGSPKEKESTDDNLTKETQNAEIKETTLSTIKTPEKTTKDVKKHSTIDIDNSDNARDDFVVAEKPVSEGNKPRETEETNSNCSSSSNLLLEAKQNENTGDEPTQEENDNENEEEDDDGDVELIESESKEAENSSEKGEESSEIVPPTKRPRLSEDSEVSSKTDETSRSQKTSESVEKKTDVETQAKCTETAEPTTPSLKRTHDVIELELDDEKSNDSKSSSAETLNKKPRTEEIKPKEDNAQITVVEEKKPLAKIEEDCKDDFKDDFKKDIVKMVPSDVPIPLYPPPKLKSLCSEESFSLDFLKKFRKSFDKMTKQDLEELVLQKVVEAIIHRSEFAEMRELIEKQEKLITSHRTKISELSKQFRDLEMVHNRVVKDIDQRNSQFIMPVKITRAVGLQVYIPNKKAVLESTANSNTPNIPASSPQRSVTSTQSNLTSPQRQYHHSSQLTDAQARVGGSTSSNTINSASSTTSVPRRGCAQKITPIRPVPSSNSLSAGATPPSSANTQLYRSNHNQSQISSQPRILNKNASTASVGSAASGNTSSMQRLRYIQPSAPDTAQQQRVQTQQINRQSANAVNSQRVVPQQKQSTNPTTVQRRPEPTASSGSNSSASLDSYMNTLSQLTGGNTAVSITPAKPKEKAVIDLTDEDEMPPASPVVSTAQTNSVPVNQGQRRSLPPQGSNTNSTLQQYGRTAPPLARIPPTSQMANSGKSRQMALQGQKSNSFASTISTPPGTSITRINVAANTQGSQRVKYSHPAPLPATPPQAFNPSWKLPPPRPTIRISNLDNGIVISWTMEESMDRHAECVSYQIYAYQETSGPPTGDSWRHVGDVKAMLLPMAVTLTQFQEGQRYYFAVRAVDCHQRYGPFSLPKTWS